MIVGTLELHLRLEGCFSLKDKRQTLRSLLDRARKDFHVSIAELDDHDLWNIATVGVSCVGNNFTLIESVLNKVDGLFANCPAVQIEQSHREIQRR